MVETNFSIAEGSPTPLGASITPKGTNFAFVSSSASQVEILVFEPSTQALIFIAQLAESLHKTGNVWHACIENLHPPFEYSYRTCHESNWSPELLDPYAKAVSSSFEWNASERYAPRSRFLKPASFDWQGVEKPKTPFKEWIIYEMHVRGFTQDPSSSVKKPGTFAGVIEKIPYLKELGVNAIELLPIFEFDETENPLKNPYTQEKLVNFWGYSPMNFFCPMQRYAAGREWEAAIVECKEMIRELHRNNIAVVLDVVYNHTGESGKNGPTLCFKGLDNASYYLLDPGNNYYNFSGTGNTLRCNHPTTVELILDSLTYWVQEMQVDGFRFDLASILTRGDHGIPLSLPPLLEAMEKSPLLQDTIWIAEAWDAGGLYQVGHFPGKKNWSEWNGKFRDTSRNFIRGTAGFSGAFARAICGSQDLYWQSSPLKSINFVTAHDGYNLQDLVSYEAKHNLINGENNNDGDNNNASWNCGTEGATNTPSILALRNQQIKNFALTLMVSLGVPMILMGDEYGHTRNGNNNPYCQDNEINWFLWNMLEKNKALFLFFQKIILFRKNHSHLFCKATFLTDQEIVWHGIKSLAPEWNSPENFIAYTLNDPVCKKKYFICFHAGSKPAFAMLPPIGTQKWARLIDTSLISPYDFIEEKEKQPIYSKSYFLAPYSAIVLETPLP